MFVTLPLKFCTYSTFTFPEFGDFMKVNTKSSINQLYVFKK